ncbi:MAG: nucleotide exchange factor GrpE [Pirellulaceae bacterium]
MTPSDWDSEEIVQQFRRWLRETAEEVDDLEDDFEDDVEDDVEDDLNYETEFASSDDDAVAEPYDSPSAWSLVDDRRLEGSSLQSTSNEDRFPDEDLADENFADEDLADEEFQDESLPQVGLLDVVESLTAMRHELKLQTKSSRGLESTVEQARQALDVAIREFQSVQSREKEAAQRAATPLVEALTGLHEALVRGVKAFRTAPDQLAQSLARRLGETLETQHRRAPAWRRWLSSAWLRDAQRRCGEDAAQAAAEEIGRLLEGYELMLQRLERDLQRHGVRRVEAVGRRVDPRLMTVVELVDDPRAEPETVVEELRPGYLHHDRPIRFAEVKATAARRTAHTASVAKDVEGAEDYAENEC